MSATRANPRTSTLLVAAATMIAPLATAGFADAAVEMVQAGHFPTGYDNLGVPLEIPSIDPAGIAYHAPSGRLFISDSEINEVSAVFSVIGANIFEISLDGDTLFYSYNVTPQNNEPTGITYNEFDGHFYMSNDDARMVFRYSFVQGVGFTVVDQVSTLPEGAGDPEGITSNPATGELYVVDGVGKLIVTYTYDGGFVPGPVLDLAALNDPADVPSDPEGIAYDTATGNLFLVSDPDNAIYEFTTAGIFVARYSLDSFSPATVGPQGLTFGPTSNPGDDPSEGALYISDGGIDNDADPNERDGAIYEALFVPEGAVNGPPVLSQIGDRSVEEGTLLTFSATASDPDTGDALAFSLEGTVPAGAGIDPVTGLFSWTPTLAQGPDCYLFAVRVTDDGVPPLFDEEIISVVVLEGGELPFALDPIDDQVVGEETTLAFSAEVGECGASGIGDGLVAYWPFDADLGDFLGGHDGTAVGNATVSAADMKLGAGALALDGSGDYVSVGDLGLSGDFSLSVWVKPENIAVTSASGGVVLGDNDNADWLRVEADGVRAKWNSATSVFTTDPDFVNGAWQHFVLVRSGGAITVYRDGAVVSTGTKTDAFTPEFIGWKNSGAYYQGVIDDLALWNRPLIPGEVDSLYNGGDGMPVLTTSSGLVTFSLEGTVPAGAGIDSASGLFTWTPSEVQGPGVYPLTVRAEDDLDPGRFDTEAFTVTVQEVNASPVLAAIGDQVIAEGSELSFTAVASDPDLPANGLAFSLGASPAGAGIDPASGVFTWTPAEAQGPGAYTVTVTVTDDGSPSLFDTEAITVTVQEVNEPPVLVAIGDREVQAETELSFTATASDPDTLPGLTAGLLAYWPFDTDFQSVIGSHHGTPVGGAAITATVGEYVLGGGGLKLDGVDDYVAFGDLPLAGDFTVSAWVNPVNILAGTSSQAVVLGDNDNADWLRVEADGVRGKWDNATTVFTTEPDFVNGSWQHFVLVRSGTAITVYRDGVVVATGTKTQTFTPEFIGWKNSGSRYGGTMDDLAVWGRALDPAEVASLYNGGAGTALSATVGTNILAFSLEGTVPAGAGIDPVTGVFSWTPTLAQAPGTYPITVRVTDDGVPPLFDEEIISVSVLEPGAIMIDPIDDQVVGEEAALTFVATLAGDEASPLADGLVAYWPFDADLGDFFGGHDGTAVGDAVVSVADVKLGAGALALDGSGDYVSVGDLGLSGDFSVSVWVKPENIAVTSASGGVVLGDNDNADWLRVEADGVRAKWNSATSVFTTDPDFVNGAWQHFVLVRSGGAITVYRDGAVVSTGTKTDAFTPEFIGWKNSGAYYQGVIDDLALWNRPLIPGEVDSLYNSGAGMPVPTPSTGPVTFSLEGTVPGGAGIDSASGLFTWTPSEVQGPGVYPLTVRAEDDLDPGRFDTEAFTVTVQEVNASPVLAAIGDQVIAEGSELSFTAVASDPDLPANGLAFSLGASPAGAGIDPASGVFTWTPAEAQGPGAYTVTVTVTDDGSPSLFDTEAITVTVQEVNEPPVLVAIGDREVQAETELSFTATASDPDTLPGLTAGLLAYWPFDTDFQSVIGSHHGTPVGGAAITATVGEYVLGGGGLKLDGVDDYVAFGDLPLAGDFTVSAWVNPVNILAGTSSQAVVLGDNDNADWLRVEADGVRGKWDNATTVFTTEPDFVNGSWQHFVLVRSGTAITVYRDGVVVATGTKTQTFTPEFIGWKNSGSRYGGTMDDLAVWGRALDPAEVASLYNGGAGTALSATVGTNILAFSLEGTVPAGAGIDPVTGVFSWTPTLAQAPGTYPITVRVTDDGVPPLFDEEIISVSVLEPGLPGDIVAAEPAAGLCISTAIPCVTVPVVFTRSDSTGARGASVTFRLSPELELCGSPGSSITPGTWLENFGSTFEVTDNGDSSYTIDQTILGMPCGVETGGVLFEVQVQAGSAAAADDQGTLTVESVIVRDCVNGPLPGDPGVAGTVSIDRTGPAGIGDLTATQVKTGNLPADGTTRVALSWTPPEAGTTVQVFRKGYGNYPEYDDTPGSGEVPAVPADSADAVANGWVLTGVAMPGDTDETDVARDFWYFVAIATDSCGNVGGISGPSNGALNYHLGDVVPLGPFGDNEVELLDISKLGASYGSQEGQALYVDTLDVGPTTDLSADALPTTDNLIEFEDLMIFALNFSNVSKPGGTLPLAAGTPEVRMETAGSAVVGETMDVVLALASHGAVQGVSVALEWNPAVVRPLRFEEGAWIREQVGLCVVLSPEPGTVDVASFGSTLAGEGTLATVTFQVLGEGDPGLRLGNVRARDAWNRPVEVGLRMVTDPLETVAPLVTQMGPGRPNPFRSGTSLSLSLAEEAAVKIQVYGLDGRLVRTLLDAVLPASRHEVIWDGRDGFGREVASGAYLIRMVTPLRTQSRQVVRIR